LRLVVKQLQMARRPRHEEVDHTLRLARMVRLLRRQRVDRLGIAPSRAEQLGEGNRSKADAAILQKPAAREVARIGGAIEVGLAVHGGFLWDCLTYIPEGHVFGSRFA